MAQGLRTSNMTIPAGKTRKLTLRGVFFYIKETTFPLVIALRQNDIGEKSGLVYENEMRKGEKLYSATEFDKVEIKNENAVDVTVQFIVGYGDYARELPERVSAADFTRTTSVTYAAGQQALIAEESFRKRVWMQARAANNAAGVRIAESAAQLVALNYIELFAGQSVLFETKNGYFFSGTAGDIVTVVEEVFND